MLVTAASKHRATFEIAEFMTDEPGKRGHEATVEPPEEVGKVEPFDAVILGSAVYAGRWRREALDFVDDCEHELLERPLWLFSSGSLGEPPKPDEDPIRHCPDFGKRRRPAGTGCSAEDSIPTPWGWPNRPSSVPCAHPTGTSATGTQSVSG